MGATYKILFYYCEVYCLFRAKVIKSIHELKVEIIIVTKENQNLDASIFRVDNLIIKLTDLFGGHFRTIECFELNDVRTANACIDSKS